MTGTGELRVLFVNHTADVSGAEISILELLTALPRDVRPAMCSPFGTLTRGMPSDVPGYELPTAAAGANLALRTTPRELGSMGLAANRLRHVIKDFAPHVIHANSIRAGLVCAALGRRRPPVVVHVRDLLPPHPVSRAVRRVLLRRADAIVANSRYTLRAFLAGKVPDGVLTRSILNPIDFDRLAHTSRRHDLRAEFGIAADASVLVHVAQITPWKAQDDSVRIVKHLRDEGRDVHLLIAGEARFSGTGAAAGNQRFVAELHQFVRTLGIADAVHFLGWRDDVACVYRAADIAILPSVNEPFGRAVAEAMAFGLPVAATSEGGTSEILRDGVDGLLIQPRSPHLWARRLGQLLAEPEASRAMGRAAAQHVRAEFRPAAHAEAMVDVYRTLAAA